MKRRNVYLAVIAVVLAVCMSLFLLDGSVTTGAWGLHFSQNGQPPSAPESQSQLQQFNAFYLGDTEEKVLYLTFDAGYENGCTASILDTLKKHDVKATFFLVGHYLQTQPDLVRRMVHDGHTVGNHTMHHKDVQTLSPAEFEKELTDFSQLYSQVTGAELTKVYRPPQGHYNAKTLEIARDMGYKTVFWSLAYNDWDNQKQPDSRAAIEKLLSRTHDGAIILLHSTSKTNEKILDTLLTRWKEMGYRFATAESL